MQTRNKKDSALGDDKNIMIRYWNNLSRKKDATAAKEYFDLFKSWLKEKETRHPFLEWIDQYLAGDWLFAFTDMFRENNYGIQNTNNYSEANIRWLVDAGHKKINVPLMITKIVNRLHDMEKKTDK